MSNVYFSVVIPSYNQKSYLKKAINSVLRQTYKIFEIIVIDNNSVDGSYEYIQNLENNKIKLIRTENFGSIAKSRNIGIDHSKGNWISFLDSDDYWHPKKLEIVKEVIDKKNHEMISHQTYNVDQNDEIISYSNYGLKRKNISKYLIDKKNHEMISLQTYNEDQNSENFSYTNYVLKRENTLKYLITKGNLYATSTITVSKKFLSDNKLYFDERLALATSEDYDLWIRLTIKNIKVIHINKRLGFYRIHDKSASRNIIKILNAAFFAKRKNITYIIQNNFFNNLDTLEIIVYYWTYKTYVKIIKIMINLSRKKI